MLGRLIAFRELSFSSRSMFGAAAAKQSVWGLGTHWYVAEICFLVPEIVFLCFKDEGVLFLFLFFLIHIFFSLLPFCEKTIKDTTIYGKSQIQFLASSSLPREVCLLTKGPLLQILHAPPFPRTQSFRMAKVTQGHQDGVVFCPSSPPVRSAALFSCFPCVASWLRGPPLTVPLKFPLE